MTSHAPALDTAIEIEELELDGATRRIARPCSEPELTALLVDLRRARESGAPITGAFLGRGSAVNWCAPSLWSASAEASHTSTLWISMTSLIADGASGIVEYVPGDGTLTAKAGASIETLRAAVHEGGHRITPAGPRHGASLGGLLASGESSIDRCTHGPARHHVLGMRIQDASGRGPTRTGGRLVKNVTGFDLHRLHAGARGTLGAILEASLRLTPVPEAEVLLVSEPFATAAEATKAALELRANRVLQPRALFVNGRVVHLLLGGRARQVEVERTAAQSGSDATLAEHRENALERALDAARHGTALLIDTAPSLVAATVERIESACDVPVYVEPDAARIVIGTEGLRSALAPLSEAVLPALDAEVVHVALRDPGAEFVDLASRLRKRSPIPRALQQWTARLQDSFDPAGALRSPDFPSTQPAAL